ncbi:MAG TPA: hypothetical protein VFD82_00035 [Planctomycetota bacterium]|nr:hypothetical protein [Planctomycetota bacterium]
MIGSRIVALLLAASLPSQIVHFVNLSPVVYEGWTRCTVDVMPPHPTGVVSTLGGSTYPYQLGRLTGLDTRALDVRVRLDPGQRLTLDLSTSQPCEMPNVVLPPIEWFGGLATVNDDMFGLVSLDRDGAGYLLHLRCRTGRMWCVDLWLHLCPDEPWARGEVMVTCSNPRVPQVVDLMSPNFTLRVGNAVVLVPGRQPNEPLIDAGTQFGDGQARTLPVTLLWPNHFEHLTHWCSAVAIQSIGAVGISRLLPQGNPRLPPGLDPVAWASVRRDESIRRLHTWEAPLLGPNRRSGDTGQQADQTFVAGEPFLPNGAGAEQVIYFAALKASARPCHHLESDGSPLSAAHPNLVMWDSRPHLISVSPDQLGKARYLGTGIETAGWSGSDVEHWFHNNTVAAARLTGSPAIQQILSIQARIYPYQWTTRPELMYQSIPFAARAVGWEGMMAVQLWMNLEDRDLAAATKAHWLNRATQVLVPQLGQLPGDVWDWRRDDRIGPGWRWMPWQQAVGAYGLDLAGEILGHAGARDVAFRAAKAVLHDAYWLAGDRWTARDVVARDDANVPSGGYDFFGTPLAIATVLRHEPTNERARAIWNQLLLEATLPVHFAWLAPGVGQ